MQQEASFCRGGGGLMWKGDAGGVTGESFAITRMGDMGAATYRGAVTHQRKGVGEVMWGCGRNGDRGGKKKGERKRKLPGASLNRGDGWPSGKDTRIHRNGGRMSADGRKTGKQKRVPDAGIQRGKKHRAFCGGK